MPRSTRALRPAAGGDKAGDAQEGGTDRRRDQAGAGEHARQGDGHAEKQERGSEDVVHGASRVTMPAASSRPCRSAIGLGGEPGNVDVDGQDTVDAAGDLGRCGAEASGAGVGAGGDDGLRIAA